MGVGDRGRQGRRYLVRAQAHVHDVHLVVERPLEGHDQGRDLALAGRTEDLERVELDAGGDADDEVAVLLRRGDAGDVRAVAVVVHRVAVVVDEVVATGVIHVELRVDDVGHVVGVVVEVVEPGVDDRKLDALAGVAREVNGSGPDVLDAPGVLVFEVARRGAVVEGRDLVVELNMLDAGRPLELAELAPRQLDAQAVDQLKVTADLAAEALNGTFRGAVGTAVEGDDRADALVAGFILGPWGGGRCRRRGDQREQEADREPNDLPMTGTVHRSLRPRARERDGTTPRGPVQGAMVRIGTREFGRPIRAGSMRRCD